MDVPLVIRQRLTELGFDQKNLASAAEVTESYISQLLARKKLPPDPERTDIYDKIGKFLDLPPGELSKLASLQRREELKKKVLDPARPMFHEVREMILLKCAPGSRRAVREIFEREPFGALERLVTQKLLEVAKGVARDELDNEKWLRLMARLSKRTYQQARVSILEFLDTDVFHISIDNTTIFLEPLIERWDIDLGTFGMDVILSHRLTQARRKRFEFVEREVDDTGAKQPGFEAFLHDRTLSGDATKEELDSLAALKMKGRRPTPLYYYRELQNLRDPLHFKTA